MNCDCNSAGVNYMVFKFVGLIYTVYMTLLHVLWNNQITWLRLERNQLHSFPFVLKTINYKQNRHKCPGILCRYCTTQLYCKMYYNSNYIATLQIFKAL